jgi:DNA-binding transcriptional LysR family regulator
LDITTARTFLEIVKTGSFVRAAGNLNITQTAVSARIRGLEQQLDRKVFIRNKAGARLTPAGDQFLRFATSLVQIWDRARRSVATAPGKETVVTIGAELSQWNPLMRHWLMWMRREHPELAISAHIDSAERLMEEVQEGALDFAILYAAPARPGVIAELLFEERLVLVRTTPDDQPMRPEDHVEVDWGEDFAASYHAAFPDAMPGRSRSAMVRSPSTTCLPAAAAAIFAWPPFVRFLKTAAWHSSPTRPSFPIPLMWCTRPVPTKA